MESSFYCGKSIRNVMFVYLTISCLLLSGCFGHLNRFRREDENDDCKPPSASPKLHLHCCKMIDLAKNVEESIDACVEKKPPPPPPGKPPGPPPIEVIDALGCYIECVYNETGLLTKDNKINKDAIVQQGNRFATTQPAWTSVMSNVITQCLDNSVFNNTDTHKCKSGSMEFQGCFLRKMFLNCPKELWTSSDECTGMRNKIEKCPRISVPHFIHHHHFTVLV